MLTRTNSSRKIEKKILIPIFTPLVTDTTNYFIILFIYLIIYLIHRQRVPPTGELINIYKGDQENM